MDKRATQPRMREDADPKIDTLFNSMRSRVAASIQELGTLIAKLAERLLFCVDQLVDCLEGDKEITQGVLIRRNEVGFFASRRRKIFLQDNTGSCADAIDATEDFVHISRK